jgi:acyl-CoA synthetase (AMP-forming)/AMP-acid ligase II
MTPRVAGRSRNTSAKQSFTTLIDVLRRRAEFQPGRTAYRFLLDGEQHEIGITHAELDRRARVIGARLQEQVGAPGQLVLILYPPGLDFISAFFGCAYAGMAAVPAFPPHPARPTRSQARLEAIHAAATPAAVLTSLELLTAVERLLDGRETPVLATDRHRDSVSPAEEDVLANQWTRPDVDAASLALVQYTSGSTGTPAGVMLSHGNLLHNSEQIRVCF